MTDDNDKLDHQIDDSVLIRYLNGVCGPAELARVERWVAADPANRAELELLKAAWNPAPVPEADPDDRMWRWVAERVDTPLARPRLVREYRPFPETTWRSGLIAASIVLAVLGGLLFQLTVGSRPAKEAVTPIPMRELATNRGERATGNLPDGSRVILGPESRLQIPATFSATGSAPGPRDVHLQGEAFFEVTHDSTRPFRVHTADGVAEDLGTEFVVTAYPETRATRVVVASGLVALRTRDSVGQVAANPVVLTLQSGDLGRIDSAGAGTLRRHVDVSAYVGWTQGVLKFDEIPLREAIARLGRWYDLDIQLSDTALAQRRFTATFHDEPVSHVIRTLEIALDVRAQLTGRVVTLSPSSSPQ